MGKNRKFYGKFDEYGYIQYSKMENSKRRCSYSFRPSSCITLGWKKVIIKNVKSLKNTSVIER